MKQEILLRFQNGSKFSVERAICKPFAEVSPAERPNKAIGEDS
jgi:hypothetical protein